MSWYYTNNDQKNGPISDSEFEALVQRGVITPDTFVWRDGMTDWQPLRDVRAAEHGAETSPLATHGASVGAGTCSVCGKSFPAGSLITIQGRAICPECKPLALQQIQEGVTPNTIAAERTGPAWEQRESLGFFKALWETIKSVIQKPGDTFATMKRGGGLGTPWLFLLIMGSFGMAMGFIYQFVMSALQLHFITKQDTTADIYGKLFHKLGLPIGVEIVLVIIAIPILITLGSFIWAAILHVCLKIVGGAKQPFETTYRVIAYAGALNIFALIPFCGGSIAGIWALIVIIIGLGKAHQTSTGKSVSAVLLPLGACCCFYVLIIFAMVVPAMTRAQHLHNTPHPIHQQSTSR